MACFVDGCDDEAVAKGMCDKHYRRWRKHGDPNCTGRPKDWGSRSKHPLWEIWKNTARQRWGRVDRWNDFYAFLEDVGERPSPIHDLTRKDKKAPYGPDNVYWRMRISMDRTDDYRKDQAAYKRRHRLSKPNYWRNAHLRCKFGITLDDYNAILDAQNGKCAICKQPETKGDPRTGKLFPLAVDHCHDKKHIRGLLCMKCNRGLGLFEDDADRLRAAVRYLMRA